MSGYYDANEWRRHTREVEQRILQKTAEYGRPQESEHRWASRENRQDDAELPPVFQHPDPNSYDPQTATFEIRVPAQRPQSVDRRQARFRDTHIYGPPPPPPPRLYNQLGTADGQQLSAPPRAILLDQTALNQGIRREAPPEPTYGDQFPTHPEPQYADANELAPRTRMIQTPYGPMPARSAALSNGLSPRAAERAARRTQGASRPMLTSTLSQPPPPYPPTRAQTSPSLLPDDLSAQAPPLTAAQKKRLRKKRAKLAQQSQNGHAETALAVRPTPNLSPQQVRAQCGDESIAMLRNGGQLRLVCVLNPWPHIGQPHMMQLQSEDGTEVFVGWWRKGE